ncbi:MAG: hypothetical protein ISR51_07210 [Rhodospirillales bacterium]|nr:hypothetical protein [Alphaproteobacteria bacterium]MBL6948450.1 hypothetical protein [Rhodospirillales bacterium]
MAPALASAVGALLLLGISALGTGPALFAAEVGCETLMEWIAKSGEIPKISINPADETVKIITSRGTCSEPIETWAGRDPGSPASAKKSKSKSQPEPEPKPKAVTAPPLAEQPFGELKAREKTFTPEEPKPSKPVTLSVPAPVSAPKPVFKPADPQAACDYRLGEIWESQTIKIEGIEHWLARAFTMDMDGNLEVDNVSFTFVAKDTSEKIVHYFGALGEVSGRVYPALTLPDESLIRRLCFGDLKYPKPEFFASKKLGPSLIDVDKPDLAAEMEAREKGVVYKPKSKKKTPPKREEPTPWWMWTAYGAGGLVVAGAGFFFLRSRKKKKKKSGDGEEGEDEEEEDAEDKDTEDEDEEGGKKPKKGFGGFYRRLLSKIKKPEKKSDGEDDEEEEEKKDDEEGDGEEEEAKKKGLSGLLARFKKKKSKKSEDEKDEEDGKD